MNMDRSKGNILTWKQLRKVRLFSHGKRLLKSGDYVRAYIIFDWLAEHKPECMEYQQCLEHCRASITREYKHLSSCGRLFYSKRHSKESLDSRLIAMLLPVADRDCLHDILTVIKEIRNPYYSIPLEANWHAQHHDFSNWADSMNKYLRLFTMSCSNSVHIRNDSSSANPKHILESLEVEDTTYQQKIADSTKKISIVMSAYNAEHTIGYAIKSLLNQSYIDFELVIVDDGSSDNTAGIIKEFARLDERIKPIFLEQNMGTYYCRNIALSRASGTYITTHDADDFCHPFRLSMQAQFFEEDNSRAAVISQWLRIKPTGEILYHNKRGGDFLHGGLATMMYRRDIVDRLGFYDQVRFSADTEYLFRIRSVFGHNSVGILRQPLVLAAATKNSLTGAKASYADSFLGDCENRFKYRQAWEQWHKQKSPDLYMPMNPVTRPFSAPEDMLTKRCAEKQADLSSGGQI